MKRLRVLLPVLLTFGLIGAAVVLTARRAGHATPAECLDAYREASRAGDVTAYLRCLGEPLRSEKQQTDANRLGETLRQEMDGVKSWTQLDPVIQGSTATVDVDAVRTSGVRRTRFRLQQVGRGWLIVGIEPGKEVPSTIPYGTHIKDVPQETSPPREQGR